MQQFTRLSINGEAVKDGFVLNKWFDNRFKANKNVLAAIVGGTGSGKTYSALFQLERWYEFKFGEKFPVENICFSISEAAKRIRYGNLRRGEMILIEEAGVLINSLDFQNKVSKFFGSVLQSFRSKNIGIIFTLPNINMMNKTARSLLHLVMQTTGIDTSQNKVMLKPFYFQTNSLSGKQYKKYLKQLVGRKMVSVKRIYLGMPSKDIITTYEELKDSFVNKVQDDLIEISDPKDKKKGKNAVDEALWVAIKQLYDQRYPVVKISEILGISRPVISGNLKQMLESGYITSNHAEKVRFFLEKTQSEALKSVLDPISN